MYTNKIYSKERVSEKPSPVVWIHGKKVETGYLKHVFNIFKYLGYSTYSQPKLNWDVLWTHDYPFLELVDDLTKLKPHQKVNHFPGSGFITNKVNLATTPFDFVPKAFKIPAGIKALKAHSKKFPEKLWIQKSNNHRGIKILPINELDLSKSGSFIQEYISNPLLIDGQKFDIGIYTILTSIHPLRVYVLESDALFRFCPEKYYPFDPSIADKYVVGDNYTPMWEMPTFSKVFYQGYSFKESFNYYLRSQDRDPEAFWNKIKAAITNVYLEKEKYIFQSTKHYKSSRNFFEMVRFDFVLDEHFNIYLMEANMSPNLSSAHHVRNTRLYEHVIYNLLKLVGLNSLSSLNFPNIIQNNNMEVSDVDINVYADQCISQECENTGCKTWECRLCSYCMTVSEKQIVKMAYLEHKNREACQRIFPPIARNFQELQTKIQAIFSKLNEPNKLITLWFLGKCQQDFTWCH
ncbi:TTLL15 [Acanthosepion pharaonis]|uniref:TTLL15 n=1 Tax=Acanthosepion pharaonis TaxID=158019 RepID=A0A812D082_ACAPH|nr:TTLL15 [Sepia pharaonis]